jgi:hypothetical protein
MGWSTRILGNNHLNNGHEFRRIPNVILSITTVLTMSACVAKPSKQIYLNPSHLSQVKVVALNVLSSKIDVSQATETRLSPISGVLGMGALYIGLAPAIIAMTAEGLSKSSIDSARSKGVRGALGESSFEKVLGNHFLEYLRAENLFKIDYSNTTDAKTLIQDGYDAAIELRIEELSLRNSELTP